MQMTRRGFLKGMLAIGAAPAIITTPALLMPVRSLWIPPADLPLGFIRYDGTQYIYGVDPATKAGDYAAWITMAWTELDGKSGDFRLVDWGPRR